MTASPLDKAVANLARADLRPGQTPAFLVLSGSFNPVHTEHLHALDVAAAEYSRRHGPAIAAFLAPSSQEYVAAKLRSDAWALERRLALCRLATADSPWIDVWPAADISGYHVTQRIGRELAARLQAVGLPGAVAGIEVMGSDTARRLLDRLASEWESATHASPWYLDRQIYVVVRPGSRADDGQHLQQVISPRVAPAGVRLTVVQPSQGALQPSSSAEIRELIARCDWDALQARQRLHPEVLRALRGS